MALTDNTWSLGEAQAALDAAIGNITAGTYMAAVNFAGGGSSGAYLMGFTTAANDPGNAQVDLIGILSNVSVNTLTSNNFT